MIVTPIHTKKIVLGDTIAQILKDSLPPLQENSVVVISSKIISITEGRVAPKTKNKTELIFAEADQIFPNKHIMPEMEYMLTITNNIITPWAGIDESNSNNQYVLWPKNPFDTAANLCEFLKKENHIKNVGVIICDSTFIPLRAGSVSVGLGWCGFEPIKNYIGTPDVFAEEMHYTQVNIVDSIASSAAFVMGEGSEQQPLAVVSDIPDIIFVDRKPTSEEIASVGYPIEKDLFGPLIQAVTWEQGKKLK